MFTASYRCQTISRREDNDIFEELSLMNDQNIKQNVSYLSLTNLSNIMDHEPNVSRKDSYSQSIDNILMHKPSLFLTDIFGKSLFVFISKFDIRYIVDKMTHEHLAKSIAELTRLHKSTTKSKSLLIYISHNII